MEPRKTSAPSAITTATSTEAPPRRSMPSRAPAPAQANCTALSPVSPTSTLAKATLSRLTGSRTAHITSSVTAGPQAEASAARTPQPSPSPR